MPELFPDAYRAAAHPALRYVQLPPAGSEAEKELFRKLQRNFSAQYEYAFPDPLIPKTVVIVPSLTLDQEILHKLDGAVHYEERLLCLLMLLRMPRTHVIFVTSVPIDPIIVDYYLHLLPGITGYHARQRLTLLSCFDSSRRSLTEKIIERPRLVDRIRQHIPAGHVAHLACFNVTPHERRLAVMLGLPIYGCDPDLYELGTKSNGRKLFREAGLLVADGEEDLTDVQQVSEALYALSKRNPGLARAVVKMNDGFSGEGNAIFNYQQGDTEARIRKTLPERLRVVAPDLRYETFMEKFSADGGIVEAFITGQQITSPSVQGRITPLGRHEVVSTHDQLLGGEGGQVFLGAHFPARPEYAVELGRQCEAVGDILRRKGVLGRYGIDFMSVNDGDGWKHYAIEINLRKGGTTHPYLMLNFLTDGHYLSEEGIYRMANGQRRYYFSSDNLHDACYRGLTPHDLIEISMVNRLMYDGSSQRGVVFHLIGALSQHGKLGVVCIGESPEEATRYFQRTCEVLQYECRPL